MAKQNGFLKVEGTLGDISFYKSKDRFLIRAKGGVSKERIMSDPAFKRTRENGTEFGMVAAANKLLRYLFKRLLQQNHFPHPQLRIFSSKKNIVEGSKSSAYAC